MKPYEKYKESADIWLGKIPFNWEVSVLKHFVDIISGYAFKSEDYSDDGVPIIRIGDISNTVNVVDAKKASPSNLKDLDRFIIQRGDLLLAMTGATIGKNCMYDSDELAYVNQRVGLLRSRTSLKQNFLKYFIDAPFFREFISLQCSGSAQENISTSEISELRICVPTLQEQTAIAKYLDHQTAIIDELIEKKTKQIALLKEKRQAIINETVTKGLDPTAKMKDSGIDGGDHRWLGEIPESWEGTKMKFLGSFINGYAFKSDEFLSNGTLRVIKISNIQHMEFDWTDESFVNSKYLYDNMPCQVRKGDLVFALTRPIISTGIKASVVDFDEAMLLNQRNAIFRSNSNVIMNWIYYTMLSHQFIEQFDSKIDKTGQQPNISTSDISNISITLPPIKVQEEICEILKAKIKNISYSESQIRLAIEKLKEYRQSLISEAVTGKIDVRGWEKN